MEVPRHANLSVLARELPRRTCSSASAGTGPSSTPPGTPPSRRAHPGGEYGQRGLYGRAGAHGAGPAGRWPRAATPPSSG
ncbi:MAG: hypothetical protein V8S34_08230 [Lawsonibacter sp.]